DRASRRPRAWWQHPGGYLTDRDPGCFPTCAWVVPCFKGRSPTTIGVRGRSSRRADRWRSRGIPCEAPDTPWAVRVPRTLALRRYQWAPDRSVGANALAMMSARATTLLFGLAGARLLGAHLSVEAVGLYSLAAAVGTFVATGSEVGIRNVYVRDVAQNLEAGPPLLAAFTIVKAVAAALLLPLGVFYVARQAAGWEGVGARGAIGLGLVLNSVAIAWLSIARAHERFGWDAMGQVVYGAAFV